jgi:hypothetical protein
LCFSTAFVQGLAGAPSSRKQGDGSLSSVRLPARQVCRVEALDLPHAIEVAIGRDNSSNSKPSHHGQTGCIDPTSPEQYNCRSDRHQLVK